MIHDPMVEEMKARPPSRWAEVVRRAAVLRRYAAVARPSVTDMRQAAQELGCGQRQAYYYVRAWRARASGLSDPRATVHRSAPSSAAAAEADERDDETGGAERTKHHESTAHAPLAEAAAIVDCAPLSFDVVDGEAIEPARLLAVVETRSGCIAAHLLLMHEASSDEAEAVLLAWSGRTGATVAWTAGVGDGFEFGRKAAEAGVLPVPPGATAIAAGAALTRHVGPAIGRLRFAPRRRAANGLPASAVPIDAARLAVAAVVAEHNAGIRTADQPDDPG